MYDIKHVHMFHKTCTNQIKHTYNAWYSVYENEYMCMKTSTGDNVHGDECMYMDIKTDSWCNVYETEYMCMKTTAWYNCDEGP